MKWRNVDEVLPDYDAPCVVKGLHEVVIYSYDGESWRNGFTVWYRNTDTYREWLYYDEVLGLIEESEG